MSLSISLGVRCIFSFAALNRLLPGVAEMQLPHFASFMFLRMITKRMPIDHAKTKCSASRACCVNLYYHTRMTFRAFHKLIAGAGLAAAVLLGAIGLPPGEAASAAPSQGQSPATPSTPSGEDLLKQGLSIEMTGKLPETVSFYRLSCDDGDAAGCNKLGEMYMDGRGVDQDDSYAFQFFQKGCDGGNAISCNHVGFMYTIGGGVEHDVNRAVQIYQKGCDTGDAHACQDLGYLYLYGLGMTKDEKQAARLFTRAIQIYQKSCDAGNAGGCSNLGYAYYLGQGVPEDNSRAVQLFQKGCDGDVATGCFRLGTMYLSGLGLPQDETRAVQLFQKSCDMGNGAGCVSLAEMYTKGSGVPQDETRAAQLRKKACDLGDAEMCGNAKPSGESDGSPGQGISGAPPAALSGAIYQTRIKASGSVMAASILDQFRPVYPQEAKDAGIQGNVVLHAVIGTDGRIAQLEAISGDPLLVPPAIEAVKKWRYQITRVNGNPVEVDTIITVSFELGR
jgi:TonB family protein